MNLVRCAGNPVLATSVAGLATSATAFATMEVAAPVMRYAAWAIVLEWVSMFRGRLSTVTHILCCRLNLLSGCPQRMLLWQRRTNIVEPFGEPTKRSPSC